MNIVVDFSCVAS